eukprot:13847560-Alexandrium_andersonii.AAC.1
MGHCELKGPPTCTPPGIGGGNPRAPTRGAPHSWRSPPSLRPRSWRSAWSSRGARMQTNYCEAISFLMSERPQTQTSLK